MRRFALAASAVLILAAAACSGGGSDQPDRSPTSPDATVPVQTTPSSPPGTSQTPPAPTPAPPPPPPAIARILEQIATFRGLSAPPGLRVEIIPRSEINATLDRLITDHDREMAMKTTRLYRLLGHFADDQDYLQVYQEFTKGSVLGFYSPPDDALWVVSDSGASSLETLSRTEKETLAHELVHALQDFHFDLAELYRVNEGDPDFVLGLTSAVEGDAVASEEQWSQKFAAVPATGGGPRLLLAGLPAATADIPPSFVRELLFPYITGAAWIRSLRAGGGYAAVDAVIRNPVPSAVVLHPGLGPNWQRTPVSLPDLAPALPGRWTLDSQGTLGEFQLRNYVHINASLTQAATAATGWTGDHYALYTSGRESVMVVRTVFSSADEADQFAEIHGDLLKQRLRGRQVVEGQLTIFETEPGRVTVTRKPSGNEVVFVIGSQKAVALAAIRALVAS